MAQKKVLYFTAGVVPTGPELAAIAKFNAAAEKPYEVLVMNGAQNTKYGETNRLIPGDFVAGTVPAIYEIEDEEDERIYPVIDPDAIPVQNLPATQAVISDGDEFAVTGGTVSVDIAAGVPTFTFTATP